MAEGRRKSFLLEPAEICDPSVGAIVGDWARYQPLYRNVYITAGVCPLVPGWPPATHLTRGRWSGGGATINRELMSISGGGQTFQFISILIGTVCWIGISLADLWEVWEEKWIIANFLSTVTWQLTLENWEIEPRKSGSLSRARVFPHHPQLWDRRQEMKSIRCRIEESL